MYRGSQVGRSFARSGSTRGAAGSESSDPVHSYLMMPNKRLKLTGGDRSKGSGVLCPGEHHLTFKVTAPCGRVARSLSAIR